jgi:hypothetical protein
MATTVLTFTKRRIKKKATYRDFRAVAFFVGENLGHIDRDQRDRLFLANRLFLLWQ